MPYLDFIAAFVDELYDVEAELRLHYLGYLLGVGQVERHTRERRVKHATPYIVLKRTALARRSRVFRIQCGKRSKRSLALGDTLRVLAKLVFHAVLLLLVHLRFTCYDLNFHLRRNDWQAVFGQSAEITAHIGRRHGDVLHQLLALAVNHQPVTEVIVQRLAQLGEAHVLVFLKLFLASRRLNPEVNLLLHAACNVRFGHLHRVDCRLVQEQLLHRQLLGYHAIGVTVPLHAFLFALHLDVLDIGKQDCLVSYDPYHLVNHTGGIGFRIDRINLGRCRNAVTFSAIDRSCARTGYEKDRRCEP